MLIIYLPTKNNNKVRKQELTEDFFFFDIDKRF